VDVYSTFLQRSFDQIFQEVALQNLPVVFTLDRGWAIHRPRTDLPTAEPTGVPYMRLLFPNMVVMAPGDETDVASMLRFALNQPSPTSIRYPKANLKRHDRPTTPIELGKAEVFSWGEDAMLIAFGTQLGECLKAAQRLRDEGLSVGVVNARLLQTVGSSGDVTSHRHGGCSGNGRGRDAGGWLRLGIAGMCQCIWPEHGSRYASRVT
jgi:1-deoxy-D-xylulose-5-phosphate synthase